MWRRLFGYPVSGRADPASPGPGRKQRPVTSSAWSSCCGATSSLFGALEAVSQRLHEVRTYLAQDDCNVSLGRECYRYWRDRHSGVLTQLRANRLEARRVLRRLDAAVLDRCGDHRWIAGSFIAGCLRPPSPFPSGGDHAARRYRWVSRLNNGSGGFYQTRPDMTPIDERASGLREASENLEPVDLEKKPKAGNRQRPPMTLRAAVAGDPLPPLGPQAGQAVQGGLGRQLRRLRVSRLPGTGRGRPVVRLIETSQVFDLRPEAHPG